MGIILPCIMGTKLGVHYTQQKYGYLDSVIQKRRENVLVRDRLGCGEHSSLQGIIHSVGSRESYPPVNGKR